MTARPLEAGQRAVSRRAGASADAREALLARTAATIPSSSGEVLSLLAAATGTAAISSKPAWAVAADHRARRPILVGPAGHRHVPDRAADRTRRHGRRLAAHGRGPRTDRCAEGAAARIHSDAGARAARARSDAGRPFTHAPSRRSTRSRRSKASSTSPRSSSRANTLRDELEDGPLPPAHLLGTLIEIAGGLSAAHARDIVHRDLKPENIVRSNRRPHQDARLRPRAGRDPAVATTTRLTEPGTSPGTPGYMAPEQLSSGDTRRAVDLFAFGVLAWELATGDHPFGANPAVDARPHDGGQAAVAFPASSRFRDSMPCSADACARRRRSGTRRRTFCSTTCGVQRRFSRSRAAPIAPDRRAAACGGGGSIRG